MDCACATASAPALSAASLGGYQSGYQLLMATPQYAMAQLGSISATPVKAFTASSYQNECRSATARVNCCCASPLQETGKPTSPTLPIASARNPVGTSDAVKTPASRALRSEMRAIAVDLLLLSMMVVLAAL